MRKIYLAGGCFWGVQHFLSLIDGVTETTVGYANSDIDNPSYQDLKAHRCTAAETVEVQYDENVTSLHDILELFLAIIDPTLIDQQGHDIGHQYRTGIYYTSEEDVPVIRKALDELAGKYDQPIVTELLKLENFFVAEDYHQDYLIKNPDGYCHLGKEAFELARKYHQQ
ncbi:MAG: peptide-methionine (S)-S-oxide reductase MsrA [Erysipelotrichaceae bacterium]|nr:peptide-methionine (S)-S-oxide reductase MsrA [Erysipelotrichaceae bacterium]